MGLKFPRGIEKLRDRSLSFDPVNTLVMNLLAEEIRARDVRSLGSVPRSTRKYLHAIYAQVSRNPSDEAARYATLVQEAIPKQARYTAMWTDGSREAADGVESWGDTSSRPKLAGRLLLDQDRSIRWLIDNAIPQAAQPPAAVEMVGGDVLPGRVVGFRNGIESERLRLPPYLLVAPDVPVDWPDGPVRQTLRVATRWVRRVVWQRVTDRYLPCTLIYRDGRRLEFRSFRPDDGGVRVLTAEGVRQVLLDEIAELHFPPVRPLGLLLRPARRAGPRRPARLVQLETADGLRATASAERFQARARWVPEPARATGITSCSRPGASIRCGSPTSRSACGATSCPTKSPLSRIEPASRKRAVGPGRAVAAAHRPQRRGRAAGRRRPPLSLGAGSPRAERAGIPAPRLRPVASARGSGSTCWPATAAACWPASSWAPPAASRCTPARR